MYMDIREKIGTRIKDLRKKKNLSQNDLAFDVGMDRSYLASVESGKRNVSSLNIERIATALQVTVKEFFNDEIFDETIDMR
jgi:transcriptional regulator with XRE-family HTH domain